MNNENRILIPRSAELPVGDGPSETTPKIPLIFLLLRLPRWWSMDLDITQILLGKCSYELHPVALSPLFSLSLFGRGGRDPAEGPGQLGLVLDDL